MTRNQVFWTVMVDFPLIIKWNKSLNQNWILNTLQFKDTRYYQVSIKLFIVFKISYVLCFSQGVVISIFLLVLPQSLMTPWAMAYGFQQGGI